jgi:hypothetical protein
MLLQTAKIKQSKRSACQAQTQQALIVVSEQFSGSIWRAQVAKPMDELVDLQ